MLTGRMEEYTDEYVYLGPRISFNIESQSIEIEKIQWDGLLFANWSIYVNLTYLSIVNYSL